MAASTLANVMFVTRNFTSHSSNSQVAFLGPQPGATANGAEGHVLPSGQHWLPWHLSSDPGHLTNSPMAHVSPADKTAWQSWAFGPQDSTCITEADGHVALFGQHVLPEHVMDVPGQKTSSDSRQVQLAGTKEVQSYFFRLQPWAWANCDDGHVLPSGQH